MEPLFGDGPWAKVASGLKRVALQWWTDHQEHLINLTEEEVRAILNAFAVGDTRRAKMEMVARMSVAEFNAYVGGTTQQLQGIARRRAEMLDALEDLGRRAARVVGQVGLTTLGLA